MSDASVARVGGWFQDDDRDIVRLLPPSSAAHTCGSDHAQHLRRILA